MREIYRNFSLDTILSLSPVDFLAPLVMGFGVIYIAILIFVVVVTLVRS